MLKFFFTLVVLVLFSDSYSFAISNCKKQFSECTAPATSNVKICEQQKKECWENKGKKKSAKIPTDAEITPPAVK
jgi:hypothetical protein